MTVVSLKDVREAREPHASGEAICCACRHEWLAVVKMPPPGERITWFDCPACGATRGQFKHHFSVPRGSKVFECGACGSVLWTPYLPAASSEPRLLCAGCGKESCGIDLFGARP